VTIRPTGLPCRLLEVAPWVRPHRRTYFLRCACGIPEAVHPDDGDDLDHKYPWRPQHYAVAWTVRQALRANDPDPIAYVERWLAEYPLAWLTAYARSQMEADAP
jgi:hypothetical protein